MAQRRLEEVRKIRLDKVEKLRELGVDPYPAKPIKTPESISSAIGKKGEDMVVAGRVTGWREHGNVIFGDLRDETGQIQIFFQKKLLKENFNVLKLFDIGDFLLVIGKIFRTEAGELTIDVSEFQLLTKSVRPLPSSWHGLKDVEERYRKRYLDLLMNPEVREKLTARSLVIREMRSFLDQRGFVEVETPTLQPVYGGGYAKPFITHHNALDTNFYLRISDEMYLKRLIVGGFEKVYEITKVFRNEGVDHDHNPEFTMFEAQIAYQDYKYAMELTEEMVEHVALEVFGKTRFEYLNMQIDFARPWKRLTVVESIREFVGVDVLGWSSLEEAKKAVVGLEMREDKLKELGKLGSVGQIIAFVFEELVEEKLTQPTIIYDYPKEVSPLAKMSRSENFTERFEVFAAGTELGNNYSELNDPVDLKKRFIEEKKKEKAGLSDVHQTDEDYLHAIEHGFPPTSGLGIGVDRLVMLMTNTANIREVIAFPTLRPEK